MHCELVSQSVASASAHYLYLFLFVFVFFVLGMVIQSVANGSAHTSDVSMSQCGLIS